ncbi:MAG: hypothetical protein WB985_03015 [Candidatus Acidiferrales bacterium]
MATPANPSPNPPSNQQTANPSKAVYMRPAHYDDDMDDSGDLDCLNIAIRDGNRDYAPLAEAMRVVQDEVYASYLHYDRQAVNNQKWYTRISIGAVLFGASSVFFAFLEMMRVTGAGVRAWYGELLAVLLTLFFIAYGTARKFKTNWILSRYKAERLRLLKFKKLTDASLWCEAEDMEKAAGALREDVRCITDERYDDAKVWSAHGVKPKAAGPPCQDRCREALRELVQYYIPKRLDVQTSYLEGKSVVVEELGERTANGVRWLFFASFAFVLVHLVGSYPRGNATATTTQAPTVISRDASSDAGDRKLVENTDSQRANDKNPGEHPWNWEDGFAFAALFLPIVAGAIRTHRTAHEYERTASRHRATLDSLHWLCTQLREAKDLDQQFELIGFCELVLEADCREFLRLVSETEWYG